MPESCATHVDHLSIELNGILSKFCRNLITNQPNNQSIIDNKYIATNRVQCGRISMIYNLIRLNLFKVGGMFC